MDLWGVLVSIFWFMILFAWIWLLIAILSDIFRDHELSGWGKALWVLFIVVVPWLGALVYLIARGASMNRRAMAQAQRNEQEFRSYIQETAGPDTPSTADELAKLADLRDNGTISAEEFATAKAKVLGHNGRQPAPASQDARTTTTTN